MKRVASFTNEECDAYFINKLDIGQKRQLLESISVKESPYRDPLIFRDLIAIVSGYLDLCTFYRLSAVCKLFRKWVVTHPYAKLVQYNPLIRLNLVYFADAYFKHYAARFLSVVNNEYGVDYGDKIRTSRKFVHVNDRMRIHKPSGFIVLANAPAIIRGHIFEDNVSRYRDICNFSELSAVEQYNTKQFSKDLVLL
jgi:AraC-like DNA-binding protein